MTTHAAYKLVLAAVQAQRNGSSPERVRELGEALEVVRHALLDRTLREPQARAEAVLRECGAWFAEGGK